MDKILKNTKNIIIFSNLQNLVFKHDIKEINTNIIKLYKFLKKMNKNIILPTFNLNFPETKQTSLLTRDITTGYLNKFLIKKFKFSRSKRPMYNYAVNGPNEKQICNLKQSTAWGNDSVLGYLVKNEAYGLAININPKIFNWLVIHYCEENSKVPYRYFKTFNGKNISNRKNVKEKMYVRNYSKNKIEDGRKINNILLKKKIIKKFKFNLFDIYLLPFNEYNDIALRKLKTNKNYLVKNEK